MLITIVRRPIGEAPIWVRDAWIGLSLPTAQTSPRTWRGMGVLTGPTNAFLQIRDVLLGRTLRVSGYAVDACTAVELLAEKDPAAAQWWKDNVPELLGKKQGFVFDADACDQAG